MMIKTGAVALFAGSVLAGCSAATEPAYMPAATGPNCVALDQVVGHRAEGREVIYFEMTDGQIFRSQLASACPGIERLGATATLSVSSGGAGGRLCTGDRVRIVDQGQAQAGGTASNAECVIGNFTRLTPVR